MTDSGSWRICWEHKIKTFISILTNSMQHNPLQMLTAGKLAEKLWFYSTQMFLPVFKTEHHGSISWLDKSTPHPPFHFFKINFDNKLSCKCSRWYLSFRFPTKNSVCMSSFRCIHLSCHLILLSLIILKIFGGYRETGCCGRNLIHLTQDSDQFQSLVNTTMNIYHPQIDWTSWLASVNINYYQFLHNAINLKVIT